MTDDATIQDHARMTRNAKWCAAGFGGAAVLVIALVLLLPTQRSYLLHGAPAHAAVIVDARPASTDSCKGTISQEYDVVVRWQSHSEPVTATGSWCADHPPRKGSAQRVWEREDGTVTHSSPAAARVAIGVAVLSFLVIGGFCTWGWLRARPPLPPGAGRPSEVERRRS